MSYQDVLDMPLRGFWMLNSQIGRIRAEETLDQIDLQMVANPNCAPEMVQDLREALLQRMGEPVTVEIDPTYVPPEQHSEGFAQLQQIFNG